MPIIQVYYEVPLDIAAKLSTGELTRFGSVVRDSYRIVTHLKEVPFQKKKAQKAFAEVAKAAKQYKKPLICLGIVNAAIYGGLAFVSIQERNALKEQQATVEKNNREYQSALSRYITSIKSGNLNLDAVNNLSSSLRNLEEQESKSEGKITLSKDTLDQLLGILDDYTAQLFAANGITSSLSQNPGAESGIIDLIPYLDAQKRLLENDSEAM